MHDNIYGMDSTILGHRIRQLRKNRGWSLAELAKRAGTSAPTIHRYEGGWDRFELATLRKIGAALGVRAEVRLVGPAEARPAPSPLSPRQVVRTLAALFWDRDLVEEDLHEYPEWVVERVLVFGGRKEVRAVREFFGDSTIRRTLKRRGVDERTRNYWKLILGKERHASEGTRS
jgi:transcriptional regulator with XRE-family HTH domain